MEKVILKYNIKNTIDRISMPEGAEILTIQEEQREFCVWALGDTHKPNKVRTIVVYNTYNAMDPDKKYKYIATLQSSAHAISGQTYHFFEVLEG